MEEPEPDVQREPIIVGSLGQHVSARPAVMVSKGTTLVFVTGRARMNPAGGLRDVVSCSHRLILGRGCVPRGQWRGLPRFALACLGLTLPIQEPFPIAGGSSRGPGQ
jgi:hypothetical protein